MRLKARARGAVRAERRGGLGRKGSSIVACVSWGERRLVHCGVEKQDERSQILRSRKAR